LAIQRYHTAISIMASAEQPNKVWLTIASLLAWVYEMLQRNRAYATIHIEAAERLLKELEASSAKLDGATMDLVAQIKPMWLLGSSYTKAVCYDDPPVNHDSLHDPAVDDNSPFPLPQSLLEARDALLETTERYLQTDRGEPASHDYLKWLRHWHTSTRAFCSGSAKESHLFKKTAQILFNVGMVFLPETKSGAFSNEAGPNALNHIMNALEHILTDIQKDKYIKDRADIEETLEMAARLILRHTHNQSVHTRLVELLDMLQPPQPE
jgi:hypothetical protein